MEVKEPRKLIGEPIGDVYGRMVGRIVGFTFGYDGQVASIGVESNEEGLVQYTADRLTLTPNGFSVLPRWKASSRRSGVDEAAVRRRLVALEAMKTVKGVSPSILDKLQGMLSESESSLSSSSTLMQERLDELAKSDWDIDWFLAVVRLQFLAQELDEETFKATADFCASMKAMNTSERGDIASAMGDAAVQKEVPTDTIQDSAVAIEEIAPATGGPPSVSENRPSLEAAPSMQVMEPPVEAPKFEADEQSLSDSSTKPATTLRSLRNRPR